MNQQSDPIIKVVKGMNSLKRPYYVRIDGNVLTSPLGRTSTFASPEAAQRAARFEIARRIAAKV